MIYEYFKDSNFMPHGICYLWSPGLIGLHVVSDLLIFISYFSIPSMLFWVLRKKKHLPYATVLLWFAIFILSCGLTHLMEVWNIWFPDYWMSGSMKLFTAITSLVTAVLFYKILPKTLSLTTPEAVIEANLKLEREVIERKKMEVELTNRAKEFSEINKELVNRELKMVELKNEIKRLKRENAS